MQTEIWDYSAKVLSSFSWTQLLLIVLVVDRKWRMFGRKTYLMLRLSLSKPDLIKDLFNQQLSNILSLFKHYQVFCSIYSDPYVRLIHGSHFSGVWSSQIMFGSHFSYAWYDFLLLVSSDCQYIWFQQSCLQINIFSIIILLFSKASFVLHMQVFWRFWEKNPEGRDVKNAGEQYAFLLKGKLQTSKKNGQTVWFPCNRKSCWMRSRKWIPDTSPQCVEVSVEVGSSNNISIMPVSVSDFLKCLYLKLRCSS